jgi:hypothetical protein
VWEEHPFTLLCLCVPLFGGQAFLGGKKRVVGMERKIGREASGPYSRKKQAYNPLSVPNYTLQRKGGGLEKDSKTVEELNKDHQRGLEYLPKERCNPPFLPRIEHTQKLHPPTRTPSLFFIAIG